MLKNVIKKLKLRYANSSWERKRAYLRKQGMEIGDGTRLNCSVNAFGTEPYLICVGEDCLFSGDTHFFTHDGGVKVLNSLGYFGDTHMDKMRRITIGNNVYIGTGAYIMGGVTIGDNVIIGAGSIVTKDIPPNCCAVGVPAKVKCSIEEYFEKNKDCYYNTSKLSPGEKKFFLIDNVN